MKLSLTARLKTAVFGDEELKIPGLVKEHATLKKKVDLILFGVIVIITNVFGMWGWAEDVVSDLANPPAVVQASATPAAEPVVAEVQAAQSMAEVTGGGRRSVIVVSDELREIMSKLFLGFLGTGIP